MKAMVVFLCSKCALTRVGWLNPGDSTVRECGSNYYPGRKQYPQRVKRNGEIVPYRCNGEMTVFIDERDTA